MCKIYDRLQERVNANLLFFASQDVYSVKIDPFELTCCVVFLILYRVCNNVN